MKFLMLHVFLLSFGSVTVLCIGVYEVSIGLGGSCVFLLCRFSALTGVLVNKGDELIHTSGATLCWCFWTGVHGCFCFDGGASPINDQSDDAVSYSYSSSDCQRFSEQLNLLTGLDSACRGRFLELYLALYCVNDSFADRLVSHLFVE